METDIKFLISLYEGYMIKAKEDFKRRQSEEAYGKWKAYEEIIKDLKIIIRDNE